MIFFFDRFFFGEFALCSCSNNKKRCTGIPVWQKSPLKNHNWTEYPTALSSFCFFAAFFAPIRWTRPLFPPTVGVFASGPGGRHWSWPRCYKLVSGRAEATWWLFCWVKRPLKKKKKSVSVSGWRRSRAVITPTRCDTAIRSQLKCNFVSAAAVAATRPSAQLQHSCLIHQGFRQEVEAADYGCQPTLSAVWAAAFQGLHLEYWAAKFETHFPPFCTPNYTRTTKWKRCRHLHHIRASYEIVTYSQIAPGNRLKFTLKGEIEFRGNQ